MESELKKLKPPTAYTVVLCSHANARLLFKRFKEACSNKEDEMVEKLAHHLALHTRMHNQCVEEVEMALVKKLKKGGTLAQSMSKKEIEIEEMLEKLEKTKKHIDNEEFVELMEQMEKACEEFMEEEEEALEEITKEVDEEALVQAADKMESVKISMTLQQMLPQKLTYA